MRVKTKLVLICIVISLSVVGRLVNNRFELLAVHPFYGAHDYDLKVLTWNVHCAEITPEERQRTIAERILAEEADVVALNEFNLENCRVLDSILRVKYQFVVDDYARRNPGDIIYGKTKGNNSGHRTIPIIGKEVSNIAMTIVAGCDSVYVMAVHMVSNNDSSSFNLSSTKRALDMSNTLGRYRNAQETRLFDAGYIRDWAKESKIPMIVMGDMNDFSSSKPLRMMYEGGLVNCWTEGGFGLGNTYKSGWLGLRIDHVLHTQDLMLTDVKVIDTGDLSDHRPVVASFKIKK